jgi:hypothetical protein
MGGLFRRGRREGYSSEKGRVPRTGERRVALGGLKQKKEGTSDISVFPEDVHPPF